MTDGIKVTHAGEWVIDAESGLTIECYVTSDEKRLLSLRGTARAMGLKGAGSTALARNLGSKWIEPYLSPGLVRVETFLRLKVAMEGNLSPLTETYLWTFVRLI
jgi:hypothetical protein